MQHVANLEKFQCIFMWVSTLATVPNSTEYSVAVRADFQGKIIMGMYCLMFTKSARTVNFKKFGSHL